MLHPAEEFHGFRATKRLTTRPRPSRVEDVESMPGPERKYRLTEEGREQREAIIERETERIERERFEPPDASNLSRAARELLRRLASGRVEVVADHRPAFRRDGDRGFPRPGRSGRSDPTGRPSAGRWRGRRPVPIGGRSRVSKNRAGRKLME
jgi:hypothetical protein